MSKIVKVAQSVASYQFEEPSYKQVIRDMGDLLDYLGENMSDQNTPSLGALKNIYWTLVMKIALYNCFRKED